MLVKVLLSLCRRTKEKIAIVDRVTDRVLIYLMVTNLSIYLTLKTPQLYTDLSLTIC